MCRCLIRYLAIVGLLALALDCAALIACIGIYRTDWYVRHSGYYYDSLVERRFGLAGVGTRWPGCFGSRDLVGLPGTRVWTTPRGCAPLPPWAGLFAAKRRRRARRCPGRLGG